MESVVDLEMITDFSLNHTHSNTSVSQQRIYIPHIHCVGRGTNDIVTLKLSLQTSVVKYINLIHAIEAQMV